jgi:hypothetical protein
LRNGKSPDVPGADGIVLAGSNVSIFLVATVMFAHHGRGHVAAIHAFDRARQDVGA